MPSQSNEIDTKQINVYFNNDLERLAAHCIDAIHQHSNPLLNADFVLIHSQSMARWLQCFTAKRHGICARIEFVFPGKFMNTLKPSLENQEAKDLWDPQVLQWRILDYLQKSDDPVLTNYLGNDRRHAKTWQLAHSLAEAFDRYRLYRTDDLRKWLQLETSESRSWQQNMLHELAQDQDPIKQQQELEQHILNCPIESLPPRVSIFGMSSIAPNYLRLLCALAQRIPVSLYSLSPSPLYFADIRSKQYLARLSDLGQTPAQEHYDLGNSLLAQCGTSACEFQIMLESADCLIHDMDWNEPSNDHLLQRIKYDIYQVQEPGSEHVPIHALGEDDRSIQIHNCHSPLRELEVLRDFLLRSFGNDKTLRSDDIIVMTPQPDIYAPYIDAIFNYMDDGNQLPISFGDRHYNKRHHAQSAFLTSWDLLHGRFTHREILDLLNLPAIQERWQWSHDQCQQLIRLVESSGVIWGSDAQHREASSGSFEKSGTWLEALQRCLLAYMHGEAEEKVLSADKIAPLPNIESYDAQLVLDFILFIQSLRKLRIQFQQVNDIEAWRDTLNQLLALICPANELYESPSAEIRQAIDQVLQAIKQGTSTPKISSHILHQALKSILDKTDDAHGFFDGRITFCGLKPMRSIPFKIICLLGMNEHEFPRHSKRWDFDLLHDNDKRYGDRDLANEDRLLFLETMLSCQETFYLSYCGQHIRSQQQQPAAAIIEEFIDYCALSTGLERKQLLEHIAYQHHLHPSNHKYLESDSWVRSMSAHYYPDEHKTAKAAFQFITEAATHTAQEQIDFDQFISFWADPSKYFLDAQYQVHPYRAQEQRLADHEFYHDGLDAHLLRDALFQETELSSVDYWQAQHHIPIGTFGSIRYEQDVTLIKQCQALRDEIHAYQEIEVSIDRYDLKAKDLPVDDHGHLLLVQAHSNRPKRLFAAWLKHLLINARQAQASRCGLLEKGQLQVIHFTAVEEAEQLLLQLIQAYQTGLKQPILYFTETSQAYASAIAKGKNHEDALKTASYKWQGNIQFQNPESREPHISFCWSQPEQLLADETFAELALLTWAPCLAHMEAT